VEWRVDSIGILSAESYSQITPAAAAGPDPLSSLVVRLVRLSKVSVEGHTRGASIATAGIRSPRTPRRE